MMPSSDPWIRQLEVLTRALRQAAASGSLGEVEILLEKRQQLLKEITTGALDSSAETRLREILRVDRESERHLREACAALEEEMSAMAKGSRGLSGYAPSWATKGKRVDEQR
jgi:hypothetical protein